MAHDPRLPHTKAEPISLSALTTAFCQRRADTLMSGMVLIWGFHFIVAKDALAHVSPQAFNALRFVVGLPIILPLAWRGRRALRLSWRDFALVTLLTLAGPVIYQIGFAEGIRRTTTTNTALIVSTIPAWTALCSMIIGMVEVRRQLLAGIGLTLIGATLVVLSRSESGLRLSHDDLLGSALVLGAAISGGVSDVFAKPVIDRLGAMPLAIWRFCLSAAAMIALAAPELSTLSSESVPLASVPNILYSGLLSNAAGFLVIHLAIHELGPTRMSSYFNFSPIIAAFAGVLILREPFSLWLLFGAALTLFGVMAVRRNAFLRRPAPSPDAAQVAEAAGR
ncbi:MAG: DMT family transporter [Anaerolineae bacterium]|nr:DMT family transporter [Anaerolineae bacterium]